MLPPSHRTGRQLYTLSFRHTEFSETQRAYEQPGLRPFSNLGAVRTIRLSPIWYMEGIVEGPAPSLRVGPWFLVKNSLFASCGGPLKSVGSVAITGLVFFFALCHRVTVSQPGSSKAGRLSFPPSSLEGPPRFCR